MPDIKPPHNNSFFHDDLIECPVCETFFKKEVMRFGHGRLISLDIDDELKQIYKVSPKYGVIYPYIYNVFVCPECWFASLSEDFQKKKFYDYEKIKQETKFRRKSGREIYPQADFDNYRTLHTGLLGYFLAIMCYSHCAHKSFAQAKKSIAAIRASWCASELSTQYPEESFDVLKQYFRYTCFLEASKHLDNMYHHKTQNQVALELYGPDVNKNMGFDGFLYLNSYLNLEFLNLDPVPYTQYQRLDKSRNTLSKVFGLGKSSKQKPSVLMNKAKDLHKNIKTKLDEIRAENDFTLQEESNEQVTLEPTA